MPHWACIAVSSTFLIGCATAAEVWLKDDKLVKSVEDQVHKLQPRARRNGSTRIVWARASCREALAKQHNRAVFLFTYDGKIDTGRC